MQLLRCRAQSSRQILIWVQFRLRGRILRLSRLVYGHCRGHGDMMKGSVIERVIQELIQVSESDAYALLQRVRDT